MVKRFFYAVLLSFAASAANAQNVQLHYDFGRNIYKNEEAGRPKVTVTLEQFKADKWGNWFYFVDIDMSRKFTEGAYTEIAREFNLGKQSPFAVHVEYDGGLNKEGSFQQSGLFGAAWNGHNSDFSSTYSVQLMYKQYFKSYSYTKAFPSMQLTGVWSTSFADKAMTFSGFIDFYRDVKPNGHGKLTILTEPQLWYNFNTIKGLENTNLSVGTEVRISNNFIYNTYNNKTFFVNPTLALKWQF
ncbi:MAG: DUF5020 family protein [Bacteroidaceae bacterium]|nr:DUF5020 family protein [Bacteroidaceae bacterium]